jgi:hypothetical protein
MRLFAVPLAVLLLAGCVPTVSPSPTPSQSSASPTPSATPTPDPVEPTGIPITVSCEELVSAQVMYDFNPNFGLEGEFTPDAGTFAATAVAQNGLACRWVNQTSGEVIDISVANLPDTALATLRNDLAASSTLVPTYGVEGYFRVADGVGEAQAIDDPFWIVAVSTAFTEPGEAEPIMSAAFAALS